MDLQQIIKRLKNLRKKWRTTRTKEQQFQQNLIVQGKMFCPALEKSVGIDIGYSSCSTDIDRLIKELENLGRTQSRSPDARAGIISDTEDTSDCPSEAED